MASPRPTAAHASVVFLKIPEFSAQPVAEQVRLKDRLEGALAVALAGLQEAERIVLEAADGAAVVILGNPGAALQLARRSAARGEGLTVGVSHGPVRVTDAVAAPVVLGDAITVASAVAAIAPRGRIAATREFRDALVRTAPERARHLVHVGAQSDARDRSHDLFLADDAAAASRRRRSLATIGAACLAIVAAGIGMRMWLREARVPAPAATVSRPAPQSPVSPASPGVPAGPAAAALATLRLDIKPQGEIFVDGVSKGKTPPLTSIQVAPGKHRIEIRHTRASPLVLQVDAGPGEELSIRHSFTPPPTLQQQKSVWRRFLDQFK